ncbi:MAG: ATP-binding cassette domain-containing protein [Limnobacter sp.]|uniref:ATP-binding cassette domain-containing protein n=1 Tax=Limnobacter sp. TaxID=2003368 RepID=UPI0022BFF00C|nr:ATP-binding cassette domain-containing protein [Limnobacter sp.]MCZ8014784.1 ATP-binding cassette domain-containing protein [Limnobacter sp.]
MHTNSIEHNTVKSIDDQNRTRATPHGLSIEIQDLVKSFGDRHVLQELDLSVRAGEFIAIVGKSGCGKSTLLRLIAQLDSPSSGQIKWSKSPDQARQHTRIMFQDPRLLPWKSVSSNVALGLGEDDKAVIKKRLKEVGLEDRGHEWPIKLSGGQKQRVALARALAHSPNLLILDEPLGALDALTRLEMQSLIESLWVKEKFTAVLVTHDVSEAIALADRILLLDDGKVTANIPVNLHRPRSKGDAEFANLEKILLKKILGQIKF